MRMGECTGARAAVHVEACLFLLVWGSSSKSRELDQCRPELGRERWLLESPSQPFTFFMSLAANGKRKVVGMVVDKRSLRRERVPPCAAMLV